MSKPKIIYIPHGNIQYSQLHPDRRAWVCTHSYEPLFDLVAGKDCRIGFEASGKTLEIMAEQAPQVLTKLKNLIAEGKIEGIASPFIHIMLSNITPEIGLQSLKDGLNAWEKYTDFRPTTGWNPECSWANYIPEIYREAGFESLVMDGDSFMLSFPEVREATGLRYDVRGHSNKNQLFKIEEFISDKPDLLKFMTNPSVAKNGLKLIFRSDCMANPMLWYLMGATEGMRSEPVQISEIRNILERWKERIAETGSFIMPYAEDAEYIGTSAYFYVKQFNQARFFEPEPQSVKRFEELLDLAAETGYEFATPSEVINSSTNIIPNEFIDNIENGVAWHGGTAKAWANTVYARIMDPVCKSVFDGINAIKTFTGKSVAELDEARNYLISAYVSDSRWPPAPTSPGRFNVRESLEDLYMANKLIREAMDKLNIGEKRTLYSPEIMESQIKAIDDEMMAMPYFGEK